MTRIHIYTDGSCDPNPGPGGWAAILFYGDKIKELSQPIFQQTTNQRMELLAAIEALKTLTRPCEVTIYSDSAYLVNAFNQGWLNNWVANGWVNSQFKPVANSDLWRELLELTKIHNVEFVKIKGHGNDLNNIRCDKLAREAQEIATKVNNTFHDTFLDVSVEGF